MDVCDIFSASRIMVRNLCDVPILPLPAPGSECVKQRPRELRSFGVWMNKERSAHEGLPHIKGRTVVLYLNANPWEMMSGTQTPLSDEYLHWKVPQQIQSWMD